MKNKENISAENVRIGAGMDKLAEMLVECMETMNVNPASAVCPPPDAPCKEGAYMGWFALNALAYGYMKGIEAAEAGRYPYE